jgi:DNA-binding XRE family transcriptional regulator
VFTDLLKEYRHKARMTQAELAVRVGLSERTIRAYEAGDRNPKLVTLRALTLVLKLTPEQSRKFTSSLIDPIVGREIPWSTFGMSGEPTEGAISGTTDA